MMYTQNEILLLIEGSGKLTSKQKATLKHKLPGFYTAVHETPFLHPFLKAKFLYSYPYLPEKHIAAFLDVLRDGEKEITTALTDIIACKDFRAEYVSSAVDKATDSFSLAKQALEKADREAVENIAESFDVKDNHTQNE